MGGGQNPHFKNCCAALARVDVWKLDTATTAECCRSIVRALFCCSRCPLPTPQNILAAKISWGRCGRRGGTSLNMVYVLNLDWISFCHSLQCLHQIQNCLARTVVKAPKSPLVTTILRSLHWLNASNALNINSFHLPTKFSQP